MFFTVARQWKRFKLFPGSAQEGQAPACTIRVPTLVICGKKDGALAGKQTTSPYLLLCRTAKPTYPISVPMLVICGEKDGALGRVLFKGLDAIAKNAQV